MGKCTTANNGIAARSGHKCDSHSGVGRERSVICGSSQTMKVGAKPAPCFGVQVLAWRPRDLAHVERRCGHGHESKVASEGTRVFCRPRESRRSTNLDRHSAAARRQTKDDAGPEIVSNCRPRAALANRATTLFCKEKRGGKVPAASFTYPFVRSGAVDGLTHDLEARELLPR